MAAMPAALAAGWVLDRIFGDPAGLPHPVVGFGKVISFMERRLNHGARRKVKGGVMAGICVAGVFLLTCLILRCAAAVSPWLMAGVQAVGVFYCLAGTTLGREVKGVFAACGESLEAGRRQVGRIVGRDTSALSGQEIRTAALETLAENLSDGVVAPLFWYMLLGLPGMMAYKMVNTLDSMVGYRNARYRDFGMVSARLDDAANYVPARLTAWLMAMSSARRGVWVFVKRFGNCHASPNSGWPEAALAGILDCRFGGTHDYFGEAVYKPYIGVTDRRITDADLEVGLNVCRRAEAAMAVGVILVETVLWALLG